MTQVEEAPGQGQNVESHWIPTAIKSTFRGQTVQDPHELIDYGAGVVHGQGPTDRRLVPEASKDRQGAMAGGNMTALIEYSGFPRRADALALHSFESVERHRWRWM
jgi:hypothetical protein